jgi:predicted nucleotidyltransferase
MDGMAFLSVRVPEDVRNRVKAIAAGRGQKLQDVIGDLITRFLEEAERRPPTLTDVLRRLRPLEAELRTKGVASLFVFGSVARGDAMPDSDVDLLVGFDAGQEPSLFGLAHIKERLQEVLGTGVDLVERSALKPEVVAMAERDLVPVF